MSAQSVLEKAAAQGIALYVAGGRIRGRGAKPDPAFLAELREHEAELVDLLTGNDPPSEPVTSAQETTIGQAKPRPVRLVYLSPIREDQQKIMQRVLGR
jgi:hypothetical protein